MSNNNLSFVFTDELPELKQTNTVYFINNASYKKIVVINNDINNFASFDVKPELDSLLTKDFIALGLTQEEARNVIDAAYDSHTHEEASQQVAGLLSKEDKIKIDTVTSLTIPEATNPISLTTGLVSGEILDSVIDEVSKNYNPEAEQDIGTVYTGTVKPQIGTWVEAGKVYLKSSYPELYEKLGLVLEDEPPIPEDAVVVSPLLPAPTGNSNNKLRAANDKFAIYLQSNSIVLVKNPKSFGEVTKDYFGISSDLLPLGVFSDGKSCFVVANTDSSDITDFSQSTDGENWNVTSLPYKCLKFIYLKDLFIGFNADGYFITKDFVNATFIADSLGGSIYTHQGFAIGDLYYFYREDTNIVYATTDFINFTPTVGLTLEVIASNDLTYDGGLYYTRLNSSGNTWLQSSDGINFVVKSFPVEILVGGSGSSVVTWFKNRFVFFRSGCEIRTSTDGETWTKVTILGTTSDNTLQAGNNGPKVVITDDAILCQTQSHSLITFNGLNWDKNETPIASSSYGYEKVLDGFSNLSPNALSIYKNKKLNVLSSYTNVSGNNGVCVVMFIVGGYAFFHTTSDFSTFRSRITNYDTSTQFYVPLPTEQNRNNYKSWVLAKKIT